MFKATKLFLIWNRFRASYDANSPVLNRKNLAVISQLTFPADVGRNAHPPLWNSAAADRRLGRQRAAGGRLGRQRCSRHLHLLHRVLLLGDRFRNHRRDHHVRLVQVLLALLHLPVQIDGLAFHVRCRGGTGSDGRQVGGARDDFRRLQLRNHELLHFVLDELLHLILEGVPRDVTLLDLLEDFVQHRRHLLEHVHLRRVVAQLLLQRLVLHLKLGDGVNVQLGFVRHIRVLGGSGFDRSSSRCVVQGVVGVLVLRGARGDVHDHHGLAISGEAVL